MKKLKLVIGDKNLSSWSMRAWIAMKESGLDFEEILVPLDQPSTDAALKKYSPSGRVPCLIDGDLAIWDSLAICEYLAELSPQLWPKNSKQRGIARSYAAEMHSGFSSIRNQLSMDLRLQMEIRHLVPDTIQEIQRILQLWEKALANGGPFLFGDFGIADAFYAPVVFRFLSYGIKIESPVVKKYMQAVAARPSVREWVSAGLEEKYISPKF